MRVLIFSSQNPKKHVTMMVNYLSSYSAAPAAPIMKNEITSIGPNDVLLGRGPGPSDNEGNKVRSGPASQNSRLLSRQQ